MRMTPWAWFGYGVILCKAVFKNQLTVFQKPGDFKDIKGNVGTHSIKVLDII
ncbi:hypothetical protein ACF0H5_002883 [Mactra antiquata]